MIAKAPFGTRLAIMYVAALAVAVAAFAAIAFGVVNMTVRHAIAMRMKTTIDAVRTIVEVEHGRIAIESADRPQFVTLLADHLDGAVLDGDDVVVVSNVNPAQTSVLAVIRSVPPDAEQNVVLRVHGNTYDLSVAPIFEKGRRVGRIAVWQSRTIYDEILRATLFALAGIGALIIFFAFVVGRFLAGKALRPLTEIAAMMSEIEAYDLSERLARQGPDDELTRLCASFDRLLDRLQDAFERRERFTADLSHELRMPLSVIRAEAELALRKPRDERTYRQALETVRDEAIRLELLSDALLAGARAQGKDAQTAVFDVCALAEKVALRMMPVARERGTTLRVAMERPLLIRADADALERAYLALLENALRYAEHEVTLTARSDGDIRRLIIHDDGPGFSAEALRHGADRFWHEETENHAGTGLGLAIVKTVVETCGGTLLLETPPEGGARVTMCFPR